MSDATSAAAGRFPLLARVAPVLAGVAVAAVLVGLARRPFRSFDTYFHLRLGEEFRDGWSLSAPGHLDAAASNDWVPTQWLPQVAMSWWADTAGATGLSVAFAVLVTSFTVAVHLLLRRRTAPGTAALLTLVVLLGSLPSLSLRPQVLSYVFLVLVLAAWDRARDGTRAPWLLVPLGWVWATCHGMWVLGVGASAVLAVGVLLERRPGRRASLALLAVPVGMLLAALATPAGPRLVSAVLLVSSRAEHFREWRAPELASMGALPVTALLAAGVLLRARRDGVRPDEIALLGLGGVFAIYSHRTLPLAAVVLAAVVAGEVSALRRGAPPRVRRPELLVAAALALLVVAVSPLLPRLDDPADEVRPFAARLAALPDGAVVLADRAAGSVLLWTEPRLDVPLHGYGDVYTDAELDAYDDLVTLERGWQETLAGLGPDLALLPEDGRLAGALLDAGWREQQAAQGRVLLSPPG